MINTGTLALRAAAIIAPGPPRPSSATNNSDGFISERQALATCKLWCSSAKQNVANLTHSLAPRNRAHPRAVAMVRLRLAWNEDRLRAENPAALQMFRI